MPELEPFIELFRQMNFEINQINRHTYMATKEKDNKIEKQARISIWDICNLKCTSVHMSLYNVYSQPTRKIIGADYTNYNLEQIKNDLQEFYKE